MASSPSRPPCLREPGNWFLSTKQTFLAQTFPRAQGVRCPGLRSGCWGGGCLPLRIRPLHCARLPSAPSSLSCPSSSGIPSGWGLCGPPHGPRWGAPSPQFSAFLDRGTFVRGLDGEQGAFEWLAEDWGHGEGQGQERVALHWPPAGLRATPNTISGVERRAAGARPGRVWSTGRGKGASEVKALLGVVCPGQGERAPHFLTGRHGEARRARPDTCFSLCGSLRPFFNPRP